MSRMPTKNESHVKKKIKTLLDNHHWFWWMTPANGFGKSGISDFCATRDGMFIAIETKANGNVASPMQKAFLRSIADTSHFAMIVSDTTIDQFALFLVCLDQSVACAAQNKPIPPDIGGPMADALKWLTAPWLEEN